MWNYVSQSKHSKKVHTCTSLSLNKGLISKENGKIFFNNGQKYNLYAIEKNLLLFFRCLITLIADRILYDYIQLF